MIHWKRWHIAVALASAPIIVACSWDPKKPFDRESPVVREAITAYELQEAGAASDLLQRYLSTGACAEGNIGTPETLRDRREGAYDLSLALFRVAESYGSKFGEESPEGKDEPSSIGQGGERAANIECALRVVRRVASDRDASALLRARARYLEGNLLFLDAKFKEAVTAYDGSLTLVPATSGDGGAATIAENAAWNRAIAKRRAEEEDDKKKDAGNDGGQDGGSDGGNGDGGQDPSPDGGGGQDGGSEPKDGGGNNGDKPPPKQEEQQPPPPSRADERLLDKLENAPTVQQELAKKQGKRIRVRGNADK